jgi:hypothetical protein
MPRCYYQPCQFGYSHIDSIDVPPDATADLKFDGVQAHRRRGIIVVHAKQVHELACLSKQC